MLFKDEDNGYAIPTLTDVQLWASTMKNVGSF